MKQIKIKQYFLDEIKSGRKTFEIRKDPNLEGIVELVVKENEIIKDRLIVNLIKSDMNTYEIGELIGRITQKYYEKLSKEEFLDIYKPYEIEEYKILEMYSLTNHFLKGWTKKYNRPLYFYDLEIVME